MQFPPPELPVGTAGQELAPCGPSPSPASNPPNSLSAFATHQAVACQAEVIIWAKEQELDQNPTSVVLLGRQALSDMQDAPVGLPALGRMAGVDPPPSKPCY